EPPGRPKRPTQYPGALADLVPPANFFNLTPGEWHHLRLLARGRQIVVELDDLRVVDADLDDYKDRLNEHPGMFRDKGHLALQVQGGRAEFRNMTIRELGAVAAAAEENRGWVQVFNGRSLDGWKKHDREGGTWKVVDGLLTGSSPQRSHLFTERDDYENFHFRVRARINAGGNSGQYFRAAYDLVGGFPPGYEAQINCGT